MAITAPPTGLDPAAVQQYLQAQAAANAQDFAEKVRQFDQTFGLSVGSALGVYNGQNTLSEQQNLGQGPNGQPNFAQQQALGFSSNGTPFLNTGEQLGYITLPDGTKVPTSGQTQAAGYITLPDGTKMPTLDAIASLQNQQKIQQAGAQQILSSNATAQANPFSYLAKFGGLQNSGALGSLLGGFTEQATGQPFASLLNQPSYTNTNLATDLVANQNGGQVSSAGQNFLQSLLPGSGGAASNAAAGSSGLSNAGAFDPNTAFQSLIGALHQSNPSFGSNPLTGFGTSAQQFGKLSPSGQNAYVDMIGNAGGENSTDFYRGLQKAAPQFASSNNAQLNL